jgi:DNA anti-recombination protein RmuC
MFDQALDNLRKATEATMQFQQEMFRQWVQKCAEMPSVPTQGALFGKESVDQVRAFQKQWVEGFTGLLNKHRETLDAQYEAGVRTIDEAFRSMDSRDPERFRKLAEELWRQSFDCLRTVIESQIRDYQTAAEKGFEAVSKATTAAKA